MKFKFACVLCLGSLATVPVMGQECRFSGGFELTGRVRPGFFGSPFSGRPFFPGSRPGIFPGYRVPREFATLFLIDHFLFGDSQPAPLGHDPHSFPIWSHQSTPFQGYRYAGPGDSNYPSRSFVDQWKGRDPSITGSPSDFTGSTLLSEGMKPENVIRHLGSPLQRIQLREREVWRYSGYSLLFEGGVLREIR